MFARIRGRTLGVKDNKSERTKSVADGRNILQYNRTSMARHARGTISHFYVFAPIRGRTLGEIKYKLAHTQRSIFCVASESLSYFDGLGRCSGSCFRAE